MPVPRPLQGVLETAITTSGAALISDPGFATAWDATIENTRRDYVAQLRSAAETGTEEVTLELDLAPLVTSAYGTLHASLDGSALGRLLPQTIDVPPVVVDTNWPQADTLSASAANRWLDFAAGWGWLLATAAVLLAGALLLAPRGFRGRVFIVTGGAALLLAAVLIVFGSRLSGLPVQGSELTQLVVGQLATGVQAELQVISNTLIIGGILALLAALGTWIWRKENPVEARLAAESAGTRARQFARERRLVTWLPVPPFRSHFRCPSSRAPAAPRPKSPPRRPSTGERKVFLAAPRGYCAGVDRAVIAVEKALEHYGAPVYVRKQIVHNIHVVTELEATRRHLRRGGRRGSRGRARRLQRARRLAGRRQVRQPTAACRPSTPPARWSPRCTARPCASPATTTRSC